jgi:hypothetical protein
MATPKRRPAPRRKGSKGGKRGNKLSRTIANRTTKAKSKDRRKSRVKRAPRRRLSHKILTGQEQALELPTEIAIADVVETPADVVAVKEDASHESPAPVAVDHAPQLDNELSPETKPEAA